MPEPGLTRATQSAEATGRGASDPRGVSAPGGPRQPAPALDIDFLVRQTFGDPGLETELLRLFDTQAAQALARLATPANAEETRQRADFVHSIKGAARAVGALATAAAAEDYEQALRAGSDDLDAALGRFVAALEAVRIVMAARAGLTEKQAGRLPGRAP